MAFLFLLLIVFILIFAIFTANIKIKIKNFSLRFDRKTNKSECIKMNNINYTKPKIKNLENNMDLKISLVVSIFNIIPIFYLKLNKEKLKKLITKIEEIRFHKKVEKNKYKIIKDYTINNKLRKKKINTNKNFYKSYQEFKKEKTKSKFKNINFFKLLKSLKIELPKANLQINLGTENSAITALIIPIISTIVSTFYSYFSNENNQNLKYNIKPIYQNRNLFKAEFSGIFSIKMIHIISIICIFIKKRKGDKNVRTSNTRTYDYCYEQH